MLLIFITKLEIISKFRNTKIRPLMYLVIVTPSAGDFIISIEIF